MGGTTAPATSPAAISLLGASANGLATVFGSRRTLDGRQEHLGGRDRPVEPPTGPLTFSRTAREDGLSAQSSVCEDYWLLLWAGVSIGWARSLSHKKKFGQWGIHLTQVATRCCGRAKASTKKRIPRLLLWRGVGLRSASDSRGCRPKAATAMNSRVGRLGGHSHDSRNLTFLFRSREATTHRVYLNEVDTPLRPF